MTAVISKPDTHEKLKILSTDSQYDLACACGTGKDDRRHRGDEGKWIYPVSLPNGGKSVLFKTLISNVCSNDCKYCPLRAGLKVKRCSLKPEETAKVFMDYYRSKKVFGLFLSSGVADCPDRTMDILNTTCKILRYQYKYKGFIHLKIIPGSSNEAIREAVSLASAVSLNIETPGKEYLERLSSKKQYISDIIEPIKLISKLTGKGMKYSRVKQTTQFIVGAADESDAEIVKYMGGLYDRLRLQRVYFSAFQKPPDEIQECSGNLQDAFKREHRLYQVDFLLRKYGFKHSDILFESNGRLSLSTDPKDIWAQNHPDFFPININFASRSQLLRVPGLGPITVNRIFQRRKQAQLHRVEDIGKVGLRLKKCERYLIFS